MPVESEIAAAITRFIARLDEAEQARIMETLTYLADECEDWGADPRQVIRQVIEAAG